MMNYSGTSKAYGNVNECFDHISTCLTEGYQWHKKMANVGLLTPFQYLVE
jgi:hypothetical protein